MATTVACGPAAGTIDGAPLFPWQSDAASSVDQAIGNVPDVSPRDVDTATPDAGTPDATTADAVAPDTASLDTGPTDTATSDAVGPDTVPLDTGSLDAGPVDTGTLGVDAGITPDVSAGSDGMDIPLDAPLPGVALPPFTPAVLARIAALRATGRAAGMQGAAFAKIGDSITESGSSLFDCGLGYGVLGTYTSLQTPIDYFSTLTWPDTDPLSGSTNSFDRHSLSAMGGWDSSQLITGYMGASLPRLVTEILAIHPAWALVEVGTNDVLELGAVWGTGVAHPEAPFATNLVMIVSTIEAMGVVPVLYTLPPLLPLAVVGDTDPAAVQAGVQTLNQVIRGVASAHGIPLIDYWVALTAMPSPYGVDPTDGIHPTAYHGDESCNLTSPGLSSGYNVRNLLTLQMLARLQAL